MPYGTGLPPYDGKRWRPDMQKHARYGEYPMEILDLEARLRLRQSWTEFIIDFFNRGANPKREKSGLGYSNVGPDGKLVEHSRAPPGNYPMEAA
eukprot:5156003-Alexandrium_andersonii.AAC.1